MLALTASQACKVVRSGIIDVSCFVRQSAGCMCSTSRLSKHAPRERCGRCCCGSSRQRCL